MLDGIPSSRVFLGGGQKIPVLPVLPVLVPVFSISKKNTYTLPGIMQFSRSFESIQAVCGVWLSIDRLERYGLSSNSTKSKSNALSTMSKTLLRNDVKISSNTLQQLIDDIIVRGTDLYRRSCNFKNAELNGNYADTFNHNTFINSALHRALVSVDESYLDLQGLLM